MHGISPIPMATDNYGWLIPLPAGAQGGPKQAIVVDPTEAAPVAAALAAQDLELSAIWATHHHRDHVGGISQLVTTARGPIEVVGGAHDVAAGRIPCATLSVADGDRVQGAPWPTEVLHVPGHTLGAVAYHVPALAAVFVGDTLFFAGCGRLFEGDHAMMWRSLQKLRALPASTQMYAGHEYTLKNLAFARSLEPDAAILRNAERDARARRDQKLPTLPTTLGLQRQLNPFLRADDPALMGRLGTQDHVATFKALRQLRDHF